ncbi:hypothetical protein OROGR_018648 [Orobanche gracilis]
MATEFPNQEPQLQVHVVGSASKSGGYNHPITAAPSNLRPRPPPPSFNFQEGKIKEKNRTTRKKPIRSTMSRHDIVPKLDLKLNLSLPMAASHHHDHRAESPIRSPTASPPSSCVSSEPDNECLRHPSSPEATSMMLVGCPRCLMYVMLAEEDPRCPKCKSTVLLDVIHDNTTIKRNNNNK